MWQLCHGASENIDNAQDEIHGLYLQQQMEECARDLICDAAQNIEVHDIQSVSV